MKLFKLVAVIGAVFLLTGCAGRPITFKSADPKSYENVKNKGRQITSSASGFQLLLFIPINVNDRHERAYQLLVAQAGGDILTDIKVEEEWAYGFIGTSYATKLTATVYPKEDLSAVKNDNSLANEITRLNDLLEKKLISEEEYTLGKQKLLTKRNNTL